VHSVVRVSAPFIVNAPNKYEKSAKLDGSCDQQRLYRSLPAVPAVAVSSGNALYGKLFSDVVLGFVSPDRDASTSVPHETEDGITRTAFVAADPLVVHSSCRTQLTVSVHAKSWVSGKFGPCSENIPTVKLNFVTSPPGE
jgi:hypothetical protein